MVFFEVSRIDLIQYLLSAKDEYTNPVQSYRLPIHEYYHDLLDNIYSIKDDSFIIPFQKNVDKARYYLTRPSGNPSSKNYGFISEICLPIVTTFNLIRNKNDDDTYKFYLKPVFVSPSATISKPEVFESLIEQSLQQIFYGAPGTGKSFTIDKDTNENNRIRTTFHPDYDYATFVGCYKPTKENTCKKVNTNLSFQDLANILNGYYNDPSIGNILGLQKFVYEYHPYLNGDIMSVNVTQLLQQAGVSTSYNVEINKYVKFCKLLPQKEKSQITYSFVPQSFTKAYVEAWRRFADPECSDKNYYLVIEEINRGNCAQIFGDLFQLLDRTRGGYSSYAVEADKDLQQFLATDETWRLNITLTEDIKNDEGRIIAKAEDVMSGKVLVLPPNLHIWATMNTSDQSLFPIDSAFKRRWDWTYVPIKYEKTAWRVVLSDKCWCSWTELQTTLNDLIYDATESEDKMLGDWFVKADDEDIITEEQLVGKIIFYLWNDVAKVDAGTLFDLEVVEKRGKNKRVTFSDFYEMTGKTNTIIVKEWLTKIGITINEPEVDPETIVGTDTSASVPTKPEYQRLFDVLKAKCEANGIRNKSFSNSINMAIGEYAFSKLMIAVALDSTGTPSADIKLWIEGTPKAIATRDTLRSNGAGAFFEELAQESDKLSWEEIAKDVPDTESKVRGWRLRNTAITFDEANVAEEAEWIFAKVQQIRKRFANVL